MKKLLIALSLIAMMTVGTGVVGAEEVKSEKKVEVLVVEKEPSFSIMGRPTTMD
ncbi:hypothetical protein ACM26V_14185 [Salipaludibacillus sp. HK11]|uniref:hypothetical protein n=1 Tax=Salipaludibacillus sp. HK11 TaxID=3394320 RepID=UPI0039FD7DD3